MKKELNQKKHNTALNEVFNMLLYKFVSDNKHREWMTTPFNVGSKTIATDGHCLISTPLQGGFEDKSEKTESVYPMIHNLKKQITVDEFNQKIKEFPTVDCFDMVVSDCDACCGSGTVLFEFDHGRQSYEMEDECPVCEGNRKSEVKAKISNGKKELDTDKFFKIGNSVFAISMVEDLIFVAESLKAEYITIVNQTEPRRPSLFLINDVELLLMPTICNDEKNIGQQVS